MAFDLTLDPSEDAVLQLFDRFFANESPIAVVRAAEPLGFSRALWDKALTLGVAGIAVPEAAGGGGATWREVALVAETVGRRLAPIPFVEHTVAAVATGDPRLLNGEAIGALALRPAAGGRWRLVPGGAVADVVVGLDGPDLVAVTSAAPDRAPQNHGSSPLADRVVEGQRRIIGSAADFEPLLVRWKTLTAAALCGLSEQALALAVDYVKERHQFGRPIGSFQALQHSLADCVGLVEGMRLLARKAAWAIDTAAAERDVEEGEVTDARLLASMAFAFAAEAAASVTKRAMQCHGSYGFSKEYDIQLYYRRARGWPLALHGAATERALLAGQLWPEVAA